MQCQDTGQALERCDLSAGPSAAGKHDEKAVLYSSSGRLGLRQKTGVSQWFYHVCDLRGFRLDNFSRPCQYSKCVRCPRVPMPSRSAIHLSVIVVSPRKRSASRTLKASPLRRSCS